MNTVKEVSVHERMRMSIPDRAKYDKAIASQKIKQNALAKPPEKEEEPETPTEKPVAKETNTRNNPAQSTAVHRATTTIDDSKRNKSSLDMNYGDINVNELSADRVKELSTVLTPIEVDERINEPGDSRKFELDFNESADSFVIRDNADYNHRVEFKVDISPEELETADKMTLSFTTYIDQTMNPTPAQYRNFLQKLFLEKVVTISEESNPTEFAQIKGLMLEAYKKDLALA